MTRKKNYLPIKVLLSYLALAILVGFLGWYLYSENNAFKFGEKEVSAENSKMIKVSNLLSNLYKTESFARIALQTNQEEDLKTYIVQTDSINIQIDSIKNFITDHHQRQLLDSVKFLISKKIENIQQLKNIKNEAKDEVSVKNAIDKINAMKSSLRKLTVSDFVENPKNVGSYQMQVIQQFVEVMNQNIPDDETNTLSQKALDSMLIASRSALDDVVRITSKRRSDLFAKESELIQNELSISKQLTQILATIEKDIIQKTAISNVEKEQALNKTNRIITIAAIIGFALTILFSIMFINDFSKSQRYKVQLEIAHKKTNRLLKSREQLISTVSHDIKTPLSTIVGFTELLNNTDLNTKQKNYTQNIQKSSNYISNLVRDLLELTKMEAGKFVLEKIPFSLDELIRDVATPIQALHQHKNIRLKTDISKELRKKIIGDPFRLKQILTNLIGNAYKFTNNGSIEIRTEIEANHYKIIIKDSGIGIKPENITKVFEEFTQADENIEKQFGGSGLGLTIAKKLVEAMNGQIKLKSVFGKGSVFVIEFPLEFSQFSSNETVSKTHKITQKNIVAIDDNNELLFLIEEMLTAQNINCFYFNSPETALEELKNINFDCILTDIQMPEMDGFKFLEKLQNTSYYKNQPVIAMTGRSDLEENVYKKSGFAAILAKPFSVKILIEVLNAIETRSVFKKYINEKNENTETNLDSIKEFLSNDENALNHFIENLKKTTSSNLLSLKNAIEDESLNEIQRISHRINPIFKQIQASEISNIIADFEQNPETVTLNKYEELAEKIKNMFDQINLSDNI